VLVTGDAEEGINWPSWDVVFRAHATMFAKSYRNRCSSGLFLDMKTLGFNIFGCEATGVQFMFLQKHKFPVSSNLDARHSRV